MVNVKPVHLGKNVRMSFSRIDEVLEMPNLIEVQKNSYNWFLEEGLKEVFADISPIADYSGHLSLEFTDFTLCFNSIISSCKITNNFNLIIYFRQFFSKFLSAHSS